MMRKKRFLSVLCLLLVLTFLPFGVFAEGLTAENDETTTETAQTDETAKESLTAEEEQAILDQYTTSIDGIKITVRVDKTKPTDEQIYFKEEGKSEVTMINWIQDHVSAELIDQWGNIKESSPNDSKAVASAENTSESNGGFIMTDVMGQVNTVVTFFKNLIGEEDYTEKTYEALIKGTKTIIDKIKNLEDLVTEGIKKIIGSIDSTKLKSMLDEVYNTANNIENKFFSGSKKQAQQDLTIYTDLLAHKYKDETMRGLINLRLHQLYSNSLDTDPATGQKFQEVHKEDFYTAMLDFSSYLDGSKTKFSSDGKNAFDLYSAVLGCSAIFNTQTFKSRETQYNALKAAYEKNYIMCMLAMAYDQSLHAAALKYKQQAIDICDNAVAKQPGLTDEDKSIINRYKSNVLGSQKAQHILAIGQDQTRRDELSKRYRQTVLYTGTTSYAALDTEELDNVGDQPVQLSCYAKSMAALKKEDAEAKVNNNQSGTVYCYYDGKYYVRTLYNMGANYGCETQVNETKARNLLKSHDRQEWSGSMHWTYQDIEDKVLDSLAPHDRERITSYKNIATESDLTKLNNYCRNKGTTLVKAMQECLYVSDNADLKNAQEFSKMSNPEVYLDGYMFAKYVEVKSGCKKYNNAEFHRKVVAMDVNGNTKSYDNIIHKRWKYGSVRKGDDDYGITINTNDSSRKFVTLRYATAKESPTVTYSWTKDSGIGLTISDYSSATNALLIDGNFVQENQVIVNKDDNTITLKVSLLQGLSTGSHILSTANNASSEVILEIKDAETEENPIAGDYIVDQDSLSETLKIYEAKYPNQVVSLSVLIDYNDDIIPDEDMAKIKEKAGSKTCTFTDVNLAVYADGEFKEMVTEVTTPIKIAIYYPGGLSKGDQILRLHNGEISELTTEKNAAGEGFTYDEESQCIVVEASKYSTYALATETSPATGLASNHPVTFVIIGMMLVTLVIGAVLLIMKKRNHPVA